MMHVAILLLAAVRKHSFSTLLLLLSGKLHVEKSSILRAAHSECKISTEQDEFVCDLINSKAGSNNYATDSK